MAVLADRIQIMTQSGLISEMTAGKIHRLCEMFRLMYGIELTEDNASACVTHFCLALERMQKGEDIAPMNSFAMEDMAGEDDYATACTITDNIFSLVSPLTANERNYIILHVLLVLKNIREAYDKEVLGG